MDSGHSSLWLKLAFALFGSLGANAAFELCRNIDFSKPFEIRKKAKPGDILEFKRMGYSHFALYLGDGLVMDIFSGTGIKAKFANKAVIRIRRLEDVCGTSKVRIKNMDKEAHDKFKLGALPTDKIIENAKKLENKEVSYQLLGKNCEYYCTLWRYGRGFSLQAENPLIHTAIGRTTLTTTGALAVTSTVHAINSNKNNKRRRDDLDDEDGSSIKRSKLSN